MVTVWRGRRQFLLQALGSIPSSTRFPLDLVVAADFHDDPLELEVRRRNGRWVVSNETHLGAKVAEGVRAARGSVVAFLEDDDLLHPDRLAEIHRAFAADAELGFFHNAQLTFEDGVSPTFPDPLPALPPTRVPPGPRTYEDCERLWTLGAGYNASSTAVRREFLAPHLAQLAKMRVGIQPYFFYRAWCSSASLLLDARPLTGVRLHASNTTPNRSLGRKARFARLASIAADLSSDAETILSFVPTDVWRVPVEQMSSMGRIVVGLNDARSSRAFVAAAALDLLRRRHSWLPRWTLVSLALLRLGSQRGARMMYAWLVTT